MNARQKCKKLKKELKKELEEYKNFNKMESVISTYSIPIEHYQCKIQISQHEVNEVFNNYEEKVDEAARRQLVIKFTDFINDILPVKKEIKEDRKRIYKSDLYIGVNNE